VSQSVTFARAALAPTACCPLSIASSSFPLRWLATSSHRVGTNAPGTPKDKLLFTPGPLLTSYTVKAAMLRDLGSRDTQFINVIKEVRSGVLKLAGVSEQEFTMIPIQGSGTFGIEAVISSVVPRNGRLLIVANGAYGQRQEKIAKAYGMTYTLLNYSDDTPPNEKDIAAALEKHSDITHVSMVHSETTSGIMNDIHTIGKLVAKHNKSFIVDAMSSFGAIPIDFKSAGIDFLITSANKCIQGSPGFAIVIGRRSSVEKAKGNARTLTYVRSRLMLVYDPDQVLELASYRGFVLSQTRHLGPEQGFGWRRSVSLHAAYTLLASLSTGSEGAGGGRRCVGQTETLPAEP